MLIAWVAPRGIVAAAVASSRSDALATGIKFTDYSAEALGQALGRALALYARPKRLAKVRDNGMRADFSWGQTTAEYNRLYKSISQ